jgi:hypothetical protein
MPARITAKVLVMGVKLDRSFFRADIVKMRNHTATDMQMASISILRDWEIFTKDKSPF